jgi:hypothetical protein
LTGCNDNSQTQNFSVIAENNVGTVDRTEDNLETENKENNTEPSDDQVTGEENTTPIQNQEEKIYITSLSTNETIYLSNNGVGINFIIDFIPLNTTENIYIDIQNKDIVNFAGEIDLLSQERLINFTTEGNMLYPLAVGQQYNN